MLLDLLLKLPQRFMEKKVSLDVTSTKLCQAFDIDQLFTGLEAYRRDLIFQEFIFRAPSSDLRSE